MNGMGFYFQSPAEPDQARLHTHVALGRLYTK